MIGCYFFTLYCIWVTLLTCFEFVLHVSLKILQIAPEKNNGGASLLKFQINLATLSGCFQIITLWFLSPLSDTLREEIIYGRILVNKIT